MCTLFTIFPPFSLPVDDSAILDCQFSGFYHTPPTGFEKILFEQQIFWKILLRTSFRSTCYKIPLKLHIAPRMNPHLYLVIVKCILYHRIVLQVLDLWLFCDVEDTYIWCQEVQNCDRLVPVTLDYDGFYRCQCFHKTGLDGCPNMLFVVAC